MNWGSQFAMFMPHGMCLLWRPELMSLHIVSDALIAAAYFTIPFVIFWFVRSRDDLDGRHRALAGLFAAFIALCGLTHVVSIVVLWVPIYIIEGWLKAATAIASVGTAGLMIALAPQVLKLPSVRTLQREIDAHQATLAALTEARVALALRVDRTETELRHVTQEQHQSSALLTTVIEAVPGMIYAKDREGRMLLANKATLDLLGKRWAEVEGKQAHDYLPDPREGEMVMADDRRVMDAGKIDVIEEISDFHGKGSRVWLTTKVPLGDSAGTITGLVGVSIDITDRKRMEKEFLHISRRSAMGEMATAIAHEINQPLGAISLYLGGCLTLLADAKIDGRIVSTLNLANEQCQRAGDIIRRLRSFVSGADEIRRPVNMIQLVDEACGLALVGSRENGVVTTIEHGVPETWVLADRVQIEQVIVNLVRNGLDAMGGANKAAMMVSTGNGPPGMAMITVRDNGPGIREDVADRLFEPFVSTKGVKGMGVGLSICRTIIEGHGGKIWAEPGDGSGAAFHFTLPLTDKPADAAVGDVGGDAV
jgi:two-component system sensor kinase FixL